MAQSSSDSTTQPPSHPASQRAGYSVIAEGAAIGAVARRGQLAVTGKDRASYLQGLLTNDIQALTPGSGCYAAWLSPQGRMLTDLHVLESGDMLLLDVPADLVEATFARLEQFVFTEDVKIDSFAQSLTSVWLHGPRAADVLERALEGARGLADWIDYQHARLRFRSEPVVVARIDQLAVTGYCVYLDPSNAPALIAALESHGGVQVDDEAVATARVEAGYPVFGVDMTEETIPLEAGIEQRAISFSKGCYVGQEVIIRVMHRGHGRVAKRLVGLRIDGPRPAPGSRVFALAPGDEAVAGDQASARDIGFVTSAAVSPRLGTIAMGYVHRDFVEPGTAVTVQTQARRAPDRGQILNLARHTRETPEFKI